MAFSVILRRLVSSAIPVAGRSVPSQRLRRAYAVSALIGRQPNSCIAAATGFLGHRNFSASSTDKKLLDVIESEIQCTFDSNQHKEVCPKHFPFKIEDGPKNVVTLEREYDDETITVKVWKDFHSGHGEKASELEVIVKKKNGASLEFTCTAFPRKITIRSITSKNPETPYYEFSYSDFEDLKEDLQKAFHQYLEVRGVKPSMANFLHENVYHKLRSRINKDLTKNNDDYLRWLNEVKTVIEACGL